MTAWTLNGISRIRHQMLMPEGKKVQLSNTVARKAWGPTPLVKVNKHGVKVNFGGDYVQSRHVWSNYLSSVQVVQQLLYNICCQRLIIEVMFNIVMSTAL